MAPNQTRLEQKSIIKFLVAEMSKQFENYRRICDVFRTACFSQKTLYKWAKGGFAMTNMSQKDSPLRRNIDSLVKKTKFHGQWSVKKVMLAAF